MSALKLKHEAPIPESGEDVKKDKKDKKDEWEILKDILEEEDKDADADSGNASEQVESEEDKQLKADLIEKIKEKINDEKTFDIADKVLGDPNDQDTFGSAALFDVIADQYDIPTLQKKLREIEVAEKRANLIGAYDQSQSPDSSDAANLDPFAIAGGGALGGTYGSPESPDIEENIDAFRITGGELGGTYDAEYAANMKAKMASGAANPTGLKLKQGLRLRTDVPGDTIAMVRRGGDNVNNIDVDQDPNRFVVGENGQNPEDAERKEAERRRELIDGCLNVHHLEILDEMGLSRGDIKNMSTEELQNLQERLEAEAHRRAFDKVMDAKYLDKLDKMGLSRGDIKNMTTDELYGLLEKLGDGEGDGESDDGTDTEKGETNEKLDPIMAISMQRERDINDAARALAHDMLAKRLEGDGKKGLRRWARNWFIGNVNKQASLRKYEDMAREAIQLKRKGEDYSEIFGKKFGNMDIDDYVWSNGVPEASKARIMSEVADGLTGRFVHELAGDTMDVYRVENQDGKEVVVHCKAGENGKGEVIDANSAEAKSTLAIRKAIMEFAEGAGKKDGMTEADFTERMKKIKENYMHNMPDDAYLDAAKEARERFVALLETQQGAMEGANAVATHQEALSNVMKGFSVINADMRLNARTNAPEATDFVSKSYDKWAEFSKDKPLASLVKPEIIATAASIFTMVGKSGTRAAGNLIIPFGGGLLVSSALAAGREKRNMDYDRAEIARRVARGETISERDKKLEAAIAEQRKASVLTSDINDALKSGDKAAIIRALANADTLTRYSDSNNQDLISYSSGDLRVMEQERLALDIAMAKAQDSLGDDAATVNALTEAMTDVRREIDRNVTDRDKIYKRLRAGRMTKQGIKTAAMGVFTAGVTQEVRSIFDPKVYGVLDGKFHIGVKNDDGASKTLLASALHMENSSAINGTIASGLTEQQAQQYQGRDGYVVTSRTIDSVRTVPGHTEHVSAAEYASNNGIMVNRDYLHNGTSYSDGNELGLWRNSDGYLTADGMSGTSFSESASLNFDDVKGNSDLLLTIGGKDSAPILVKGTTLADGTRLFKSDDPAINQIIRDGSYDYAQVVYETGVDASGASNMEVFATHVGTGSTGGFDIVTPDTTIHDPVTVYDVVGPSDTLKGDTTLAGAFMIPFVQRRNTEQTGRPDVKPAAKVEPYRPVPETSTDDDKKPDPTPPTGGTPTGGPNPTPDNPSQPDEGNPSNPDGGQTNPDGGNPSNPDTGDQTNPDSQTDNHEGANGMRLDVDFTDDEINAMVEARDLDDREEEIEKNMLINARNVWNAIPLENRLSYINGGSAPAHILGIMDALRGFGLMGDPATVDAKKANIKAYIEMRKAAEAKVDNPEYGAITDPNNLHEFAMSDEKIKELTKNNGSGEISDRDLALLREEMADWNAMSEAQRDNALNSLGSLALLRKYGLIPASGLADVDTPNGWVPFGNQMAA